MLLSGEPGIGKSRLLAALEDRVTGEPHVSLRYFCSPHHQDSPFHPVIVRMGRDAGLERRDTAADRLAKLEAVLAPTAPPAEHLVLLAALLSVPIGDRDPVLKLDPRQRKAGTIEALLRWLSELGRAGPVLMIFEDVHWADPSSIELLDALIDRVPELSILLLISFRPEFAPTWFGQPHVRLMALGRLDRHDAASLAARVATERALSPELRDRIVNRAEGVPLFIEELTKSIVEGNLLNRNGTTPRPDVEIPASLHDSLSARLDRLQGGREIAQIGAVIGREFSFQTLSDVSGLPADALEAPLAELVRSELLFRTGTPPDVRYIFKHVLVQQAAYETLLRSRRRELHARVATAIMQRIPDEAVHRWQLLVHHATLSDDHELVVRACIGAGERSLKLFAQREAYRLSEHGLQHLGGLPDGERRVRFHVKLLWIKVHATYRHGADVAKLADQLQEVADTAMALGLNNQAVAALHDKSWLLQWSNDFIGASGTSLKAEEASRYSDEITRCYQFTNTSRCLLEVEQQVGRALAMVDEAETMARALHLEFVELDWARAHALRWKGDLDSAHALMSRAVELARLREERWREVECLIWLAMIDLERRNLPAVELRCNEIDDIARRLDHALPPVSTAFRALARVQSCSSDASPMLEAAVRSLRDFDDKAHLAYVLNVSAQAFIDQGRQALARAAAAEALTAAQAMSRTTETVIASAILARVEFGHGDLGAARTRVQTLISECDFETLSARAKSSLVTAANEVGVALEYTQKTGNPMQGPGRP